MANLKTQSGLVASLAFGLILLAAESKTVLADMIYVAGAGHEFGTLDLTPGLGLKQFTETTVFNLANSASMNALGLNGTNSLTGLDSNGEAYTINAQTGAVTTQGSIGTVAAPLGGGGVGGILYSVDANTAVITELTFPGLTSRTVGSYSNPDGFLVNGENGFLYYASQNTNNTGTDFIYKISIATGQATLLSTINYSALYAGVYDYNNATIYGFDAAGDIITLNATTGVATLAGSYSLPGGDAIYAAAIPEPSAMALLGVGIVCTAGMALRRRFATA